MMHSVMVILKSGVWRDCMQLVSSPRLSARGPAATRTSAAQGAGYKNVFWDRFRPFGDHFSAFPAKSENRQFLEILTILGHFGPF